jgi:hypothetical protein
MTRGFLTCLLVITGAAGLGYWLWSDSTLTPPSTLKLEEIIRTQPQTAPNPVETTERFSAGPFVELIDLSTVYEPTGEELALQFLLGSIDNTDYLPMPREAEFECLPQPGCTGGEVLPQPRQLAADRFPDAGETECLPLPRDAEFECLPQPGHQADEVLPPPRRLAAAGSPDAGEEASSPPTVYDVFRGQMGEVLARKLVEMLSVMQPLKGNVPAPIDGNNEM